MNISKIKNRWPVSCSDSLAAIDRMSVSDALEHGLITQEEKEAITEMWITNMTIAMETKSHVTAEELHPIPNSEIVRRFRKGVGRGNANPGCE